MKASWLLLLTALVGSIACSSSAAGGDDDSDDDPSESSSSGGATSSGGASSGGSSSSGSGGASSGGSSGGASSSGGSSGSVQAQCLEGYRVLESGDSVTFDSAQAGTGNDLKEYCVLIPASTTVKIMMSGGACDINCNGDDVHILLRQGQPPEDFGDDGESKEWTYGPGPGSNGEFGKSVAAGPVYITTYDDANTLGYSDVTMTLEVE